MNQTVPSAHIHPGRNSVFDRAFFRWLKAYSADWFATAALGLFVVIIVGSVFANAFAPHDPFQQNLLMRLKPPVGFEGGLWRYPFGTDLLGRDILSRVMYGGRWSLGIGFAVVLIGGAVGTIVGLLTGYFGGRIDAAVMRYIDFQTSIPYFLLALTIMAAIGPGVRNLVIVLSIGSWPLFARFARSIMLSLKSQAFIEAARVGGAKEMTIMVRHAFPNILSPLTTLSTLELSRIILSEAGLSYLGMGVQPPNPAWGLMVSEAHDYVATANWAVTIPGLFILLTVLSINICANRLRRSTDPLQRGRA
ncbi:ABC transporter permease [Aminobacter sp. Piv2-1]|uniref:ABC transporter permease n=1 Tax=Aminobacter sp. Piv2-1 TaxID=3031122 RepID=UPI0030ACB78D